jgi:phospholipase/carboxylesterase
MSAFDSGDPHGSGEIYASGAALETATGVVVLIHGRGASAADILGVSGALMIDGQKIAFLAPEAVGGSWYPNSFLAARASNEPWVTSALNKVNTAVQLAVSKGVPLQRIVVGGFSQGACLATEFVATHPARYGGLIAWTGGLIGAPGTDLSHAGTLGGTPTLQSSGDPDPHVPWSRVEESAQVLAGMGAEITLRRYPGKPHSVSADEIALARALVQRAFAA